MSDIDRYEGILKALHAKPYRGNTVKSDNLRLPSNPKRALADMQAALKDQDKLKKERGWG